MGQDAALAIEDIACVALAALHTVVVAVTLQTDGSTAGLADTHAALVMAVGRTGDSWNRRQVKTRSITRTVRSFLRQCSATQGEGGVCVGDRGRVTFPTCPDHHLLCLWEAFDLLLLK